MSMEHPSFPTAHQPNTWFAFGGGTVGLGALVAALPLPPQFRALGVTIGLLGLGLLAMGALELVRGQRHLRLLPEHLEAPGLFPWSPTQQVPWSELTGGQIGQQNGQPVLLLHRGRKQPLLVTLAHASELQEVYDAVHWHTQWAATGDPPFTLPAWRAFQQHGGFGWVARPDHPPEPIQSWDDLIDRPELRRTEQGEAIVITGRPPAPEAVGASARDLATWLGEVQEVLADLGIEGHLDRRNLAFIRYDKQDVYELYSLMREIAGLGRMAPGPRRDHIAEHFTELAMAQAAVEERLAQATSPEALGSDLTVIVADPSRVGGAGVQKPLGGPLVAVLAVRTDHGLTVLPEALVEAWGVAPSELFGRIAARLAEGPVPELTGSGEVRHLEAPDAAPWLLALDTLADTSAGLLVIVPHQGHIALVEDALTGAITAGPSLLMIAAEASAIAPRPASSGLFVYWRSRFHPVEVRPAPDGGVALVPPPQIASEIIRAQESPAT